MATSLINTTPQATYESLLKLGDNSALSATLKRISDGAGNDTPIEISTAAVQFGGTTGMYWDNTNRRLGIGTNAPTYGLDVTQNVSGGIFARLQNTNVGGFGLQVNAGNGATQYAIQWGNYLGGSGGRLYPEGTFIGAQSVPTARLQVRGSGATSATTALRVENSAGTASLTVTDDGNAAISGSLNCPAYASASSIRQDSGGVLGVIRHQGNQIGMGNNTTGDASALLTLTSTTKGFLPPKMTTTQKNAIASPAAGLVVYDTDTNKLCCYNGTTWNDLF